MTVITLTTDFGSGSPITGRLAGRIWQAAPEARLVELSHEIPPGDIIAAQVLLENTTPYFPPGSLHLVLVGLGTRLDVRPLVARLGSVLFAGPDNGLITPLLEQAETNRWPMVVYHAGNREYWQAAGSQDAGGAAETAGRFLPEAVYAPLAGHVARGVPLEALGERINDPLRQTLPAPEMLDLGWRGQVVQVDHFGNLAINLRRGHLEGMGPVRIITGGQVIQGIARTFGDALPGDLIAMFDSSNRLSICVVNGSAAERLNAHAGDVVEVQPLDG